MSLDAQLAEQLPQRLDDSRGPTQRVVHAPLALQPVNQQID